MADTQLTIPGVPLPPERIRPTDLLAIALNNNAAIDVIERLAALQRQELEKVAEQEFNQAMNAVQSELGRIAPDLTNPQTRSKYASYAAIDRAIRPIYTKHGFSLSFTEEPTPEVEMIRVIGFLSHAGGHTRKYLKDMPADGKGAKGGDVMTKTHARGAADAYAKRYMVKDIFNLAIGEEDTDGNLTNGWLAEKVEWLDNCRNVEELQRVYAAAFKEASADKNYKALAALTEKRDARKKALANGD